MTKFAMSAFLIAVGLSGSLHPSTAQTNGAVDEVIRQAVSALGSNDQFALDKLSIDAAEFKKYVWPALAVHMSGSDISADRKVSRVGITEANTTLAGKKWEVVERSTPFDISERTSVRPGWRSVEPDDQFGQPVLVRWGGGLRPSGAMMCRVRCAETKRRHGCPAQWAPLHARVRAPRGLQLFVTLAGRAALELVDCLAVRTQAIESVLAPEGAIVAVLDGRIPLGFDVHALPAQFFAAATADVG